MLTLESGTVIYFGRHEYSQPISISAPFSGVHQTNSQLKTLRYEIRGLYTSLEICNRASAHGPHLYYKFLGWCTSLEFRTPPHSFNFEVFLVVLLLVLEPQLLLALGLKFPLMR